MLNLGPLGTEFVLALSNSLKKKSRNAKSLGKRKTHKANAAAPSRWDQAFLAYQAFLQVDAATTALFVPGQKAGGIAHGKVSGTRHELYTMWAKLVGKQHRLRSARADDGSPLERDYNVMSKIQAQLSWLFKRHSHPHPSFLSRGA